GGEARDVTIMFTDLRNFSALAETVTPQNLTHRVSAYLEAVSKEVARHRGTVDKYIGDSIMALWNAPKADSNHVEHACLAALHGMHAFQFSNQQWAEKGWAPLGMRVGLHTDNVIVGIIGSTEHHSYTALGDGVNIASRLEGINKIYGTGICASHAIHCSESERFLFRPLDYVAVKGRKGPMLIYELMARLANDHPELAATENQKLQAAMTFAAFNAWSAADFITALALYQKVLEAFPGDGVALLYIARCQEALNKPPLT
ncbi:MAG: adenylate/guanylate cyclase domain-containing protein, partial [Verrucomicrobiota bacterium]